jgi:hypothetical protein
MRSDGAAHGKHPIMSVTALRPWRVPCVPPGPLGDGLQDQMRGAVRSRVREQHRKSRTNYAVSTSSANFLRA